MDEPVRSHHVRDRLLSWIWGSLVVEWMYLSRSILCMLSSADDAMRDCYA